ncbi:MAG: hypothetical protein AAB380_08340 [Verrucomicrobiota bacterium]
MRPEKSSQGVTIFGDSTAKAPREHRRKAIFSEPGSVKKANSHQNRLRREVLLLALPAAFNLGKILLAFSSGFCSNSLAMSNCHEAITP